MPDYLTVKLFAISIFLTIVINLNLKCYVVYLFFFIMFYYSSNIRKTS